MKSFILKKINLIALVTLSVMLLNCQKQKVQQKVKNSTDFRSNTYHFTPISSYQDLELIRANPSGSFVLTNDIVFPKDYSFEPIPIFSGIFDGGVYLDGEEGFVIYHLNINLPDKDYVGLFGELNQAEIRNLNIGYAKIKGKNNVGVIAASAQSSKIINSNVYESTVYGKNNVGGFLGSDQNSVLKNITWADNEIHGDIYVGGLIGYAKKTMIFEGFTESVTEVFGINYVGGIIGLAQNLSLDKTSHYVREIRGFKHVGGFIGYAQNSDITNSNLYLEKIHGVEKVGGFFGSLNNSRVRHLKSYNIFEDITAIAELGGVVGQVVDSYLENMHYSIPNLTAETEVGGIAGYAQNTDFIKMSVNSGIVQGKLNVGGLIGSMIDGSMRLSFAQVEVNAQTTLAKNIGGLIGSFTGVGAILENSYATGLVTGTDRTDHVGGLVGYQKSGKINKTYSTGIITGASNTTAALVGYREDGQLLNSYAKLGDQNNIENHSFSAPNPENVKFLTEQEAKQASSFNTWNFITHWYFKNNEAWPKLY